MKTFFIRHSSKLNIDDDTMYQLWANDMVGIHYPYNKFGKLEKYDSRSKNPNDYSGKAKSNMKILNDLAKKGGYVFSVYRGITEVKVGYVRPNSRILLFKGKWGNENKLKQREAIIKVLKLSKVKNLELKNSISLISGQPRQGTICVWSKAETRVENLVLNKNKITKLINLTPDQQEVMCMEFLRLPIVEKFGLPKIESTLTPIGRTLKDVDIYGISSNGEKVICQVSFHEYKETSKKFKTLIPYAAKNNNVIYFCRISGKTIKDNVIIFPLEKVFTQFTKTRVGKLWLKAII